MKPSDQPEVAKHLNGSGTKRSNAFAKVCFYIIDNARKEGLVEHPKDWRFCGAAIPGYPALHPLESDFWPTFWKLYLGSLSHDAGKIVRPLF